MQALIILGAIILIIFILISLVFIIGTYCTGVKTLLDEADQFAGLVGFIAPFVLLICVLTFVISTILMRH